MSGITIHPSHITIRAKLMSRAEIDWVIQTLAATRESLFPKPQLYDVIFLGHGEGRKIPAIKEIRALAGLDLLWAKNISERPGSTILEGVDADKAAHATRAMQAVGATVEMRFS